MKGTGIRRSTDTNKYINTSNYTKTSVETTKSISKFVHNLLNLLSRYPIYIFNKNNGISQPSSILL